MQLCWLRGQPTASLRHYSKSNKQNKSAVKEKFAVISALIKSNQKKNSSPKFIKMNWIFCSWLREVKNIKEIGEFDEPYIGPLFFRNFWQERFLKKMLFGTWQDFCLTIPQKNIKFTYLQLFCGFKVRNRQWKLARQLASLHHCFEFSHEIPNYFFTAFSEIFHASIYTIYQIPFHLLLDALLWNNVSLVDSREFR